MRRLRRVVERECSRQSRRTRRSSCVLARGCDVEKAKRSRLWSRGRRSSLLGLEGGILRCWEGGNRRGKVKGVVRKSLTPPIPLPRRIQFSRPLPLPTLLPLLILINANRRRAGRQRPCCRRRNIPHAGPAPTAA
jgi:hypothetical protein